MKLLITTQAVDVRDPVLGFFHEWLKNLALHVESLEVVCLREGEHALPQNVRVHSLGKEKGVGRFQYVTRFFTLIRSLSYDAVFVHMNPEYVILGGIFWKLSGKKIYLWYNHPKGGFRLWLSMLIADTVFHTSPFAASAGKKKSVRMPAGIDTERFRSHAEARKPLSVYLQGRVAPSKRVNTACEAIDLLRSEGINATLTIVGPEDSAYVSLLKERYKQLIEEGAVSFLGPKPHHETPSLFALHAVSLNLAASGHYDKTVLESMACETPVIVASRAFEGLVPEVWTGKETPQQIQEALIQFFALSEEERRKLGRMEREAVVQKESLASLVEKLATLVV